MQTTRRTTGRRSAAERGFTLMEVLLVLVILVILGSLAVGVFPNAQKKAQIDAARSQIGLLKTPLEMYYLAMNEFPASAQGLDALRNPPGDAAGGKWAGPYAESIPVDPWGNPYQYANPGTHNPDKYDIWSFGPDGAPGTADDIGNW